MIERDDKGRFLKGHKINVGTERNIKSKKRISQSRVKLWQDLQYRERQLKARLGENHINWNGGSEFYWHDKAWELFGLPYCEECGITNIEHKERVGRRLSMHNVSIPKNYTILEQEFWLTVCELGCHQKLEKNNARTNQIIICKTCHNFWHFSDRERDINGRYVKEILA